MFNHRSSVIFRRLHFQPIFRVFAYLLLVVNKALCHLDSVPKGDSTSQSYFSYHEKRWYFMKNAKVFYDTTIFYRSFEK